MINEYTIYVRAGLVSLVISYCVKLPVPWCRRAFMIRHSYPRPGMIFRLSLMRGTAVADFFIFSKVLAMPLAQLMSAIATVAAMTSVYHASL